MPKATSSANTYVPVPAGVHHAICYQVIDIGTQPQVGNFPARRKVKIVWELPHERFEFKDKDGSSIELPRCISKDYTLSTDKKANLRKELESWRGRPFTEDEVKGFEVGSIVGANCQLNVVHKRSADGTKTYANVNGVMPLAKGSSKLAPENLTMVYDIAKEGPITFPESMPEWMQNQIKNSDQYIERQNPHRKGPTEAQMANQDASIDEDVPF